MNCWTLQHCKPRRKEYANLHRKQPCSHAATLLIPGRHAQRSSVMFFATFLFWFAVCVSHPTEKHVKRLPRVRVFDGTDKTVPKTLKDNTVIDQIEEINDERKNNFFEADIVLTQQDVHERGVDTSETGDAKGAKVEVESIGHKRKGIRTRRKIWPSRIIPTAISSGMNDVRPNILAAMKEIHDVSCVRFKDREAADKHWIQFVRKNGCSSKVGREYFVPGAQEVSIGIGCNSKGIVLHEIMHAIGFWHEQSRTDRDKYLSVQWQNIKPGQEKNFNKYPASEVDFAGGMYDFDSLMHYGNYAFSKNRKATLVALKNPKLQFGRRLKLSKTDILQLNAMYDCKTRQGGWSSWTDWGPCDHKCTVIRERFCAAKDKSKCSGVDADGIQTQKKRCETEECNVPLNGSWGRWGPWSACSVTCGKGYQTRSRMCDDPPPQFGGDICEGMLVEVQNCEGKGKKCKKGRAKSRKKKGRGWR